MNKQEALEALLTKARQWEHPHEEVRWVDVGTVFQDLSATVQLIDRMVAMPLSSRPEDYSEELKRLLTVAGAAALYLLADEVELVQGRSLEKWLAAKGEGIPQMPGYARMHPGSNPQPVNGTIGKELR